MTKLKQWLNTHELVEKETLDRWLKNTEQQESELRQIKEMNGTPVNRRILGPVWGQGDISIIGEPDTEPPTELQSSPAPPEDHNPGKDGSETQ